jgi:hypothetical protein
LFKSVIKSNIIIYIFKILAAREVFEKKRKEHYNEFQTAKILAKQMMDDEEDENDKPNNDASML